MPGKEWIDFGASLGGDLLGGMFGAIDGALSRQWQEKMWHMQNEYNSPKAQIARLKEAGLNPAMMYANGSAGGPSASVPSAPAPIMKGMKLDFARALQAKRDAQIQDKQLEGIQKDLEYKDSVKTAQDLDNTKKRLEIEKLQFDKENLWELDKTMTGLEIEVARKNLQKIDEEIATLVNNRELANNAEARAQAIHDWTIKLNQAEYNGKLLENSWKQVRNQLQNLDLETKTALKELNFDPDNPPQSYRDYATWVELANKTASLQQVGQETANAAMNGLDKVFQTLPSPMSTMFMAGARLLQNFVGF